MLLQPLQDPGTRVWKSGTTLEALTFICPPLLASSIPLLIGSPRLELIALRNDIDSPRTSPTPSCTIPFRQDPDFVDRESILDSLSRNCALPASRAALVGLGGVGLVEPGATYPSADSLGRKSQLAIEYGY